MSADGRDAEVIRECLVAAVEGPFFPDWEFHTLFGLTRAQVAEVARCWPRCEDEEAQALAVNNSLANLLGYPHGEADAWRRFISVPPEGVREVLTRWRSAGSSAL